MNMELKLRSLIKRALIAYSGAVGIVVFALAISLSRGAGVKPLLILLPLFVILFGGITYQLLKELRDLKRQRLESASCSATGET
jgi:hypothetical protein